MTVLLTGACSPSVENPGSAASHDGLFSEQIAKAIKDSSAEGASDGQVALLERAQSEGQVTVEMVRQAQRAYTQCAKAAGVEVTFEETTRADGWLSTVIVVDGKGKPGAEQAALACERTEAQWVSALYNTQPAAAQATSDFLDQQAPALSACLTQAGFVPEPQDTGMELAMLSTRADDPVMRDAGAMCLTQIGVDGF